MFWFPSRDQSRHLGGAKIYQSNQRRLVEQAAGEQERIYGEGQRSVSYNVFRAEIQVNRIWKSQIVWVFIGILLIFSVIARNRFLFKLDGA
jgi:hypothetical protein